MKEVVINILAAHNLTTCELSEILLSRPFDFHQMCTHPSPQEKELLRELMRMVILPSYFPLNIITCGRPNFTVFGSSLPFMFLHGDIPLIFTPLSVDAITGVDAVNYYNHVEAYQFKIANYFVDSRLYADPNIKLSQLVIDESLKQPIMDRGGIAHTVNNVRNITTDEINNTIQLYQKYRSEYGSGVRSTAMATLMNHLESRI